MSWIRDETGDLVNLDKVRYIEVAVLDEEGDEGETHCVIARGTEGEDWSLGVGSEDHCLRLRDSIAAKLAMVRV